MKLWKDMTPEEKGALLLAYHEGKVIEHTLWSGNGWFEIRKDYEGRVGWYDDLAYRVKPEPREFWLWCNGEGQVIQKYSSPIERHQMHLAVGDELIRVREVLE